MIAATSAEPLAGGLTMIAFGVGTMPAMVMTGIGAARMSTMLRGKGARLGLGMLIVVLGLLTITMPLTRLIGHGH
jgi:sulfite exporter TauE/SafE